CTIMWWQSRGTLPPGEGHKGRLATGHPCQTGSLAQPYTICPEGAAKRGDGKRRGEIYRAISYWFRSCLNRNPCGDGAPTVLPLDRQLTLMWQGYHEVSFFL